MPTKQKKRLYEIARDLNYPVYELQDAGKELSIPMTSAFSVIYEGDEEKLRKRFPKRPPNPCLKRTKPKKQRSAKKGTPKKKATKKRDETPKPEDIVKKEEPEIVTESTTTEEQAEASVTGTTPESQSAEDSPVTQQQEKKESKTETPNRPPVLPLSMRSEKEKQLEQQRRQKEAEAKKQMEQEDNKNAPNLGRIEEGSDDFQIGKIVHNAPNKKEKGGRKRQKKSAEQRQEQTQKIDKRYLNSLAQPSVPRRQEKSTKGSKLQRMRLVYGHEIPKKERAQTGNRSASSSSSLEIQVPINLKDLSDRLGIKAPDVIRFLMTQGIFINITDTADLDLAQSIAKHFKIDALFTEAPAEEEVLGLVSKADESRLEDRPPVVTIMGHVDHGKTSLLDAIRSSALTKGETGGITQHIGGYQVEKNGQLISFLDTPGHAAFTSMRARGADVTDIVILVVAANDGMMPQTEEAVRHAKQAKKPIIVAVNKCDLKDAKPDKVQEQLTALELIPEKWGGETIYCNVSAITGEGIDHLLEMILLQSEVLELKADYHINAEGVVVEANIEKGRGVVASVLVTQGVLKKGDPALCGTGYGFIRQMTDETGAILKEAKPSRIVKIMGLSDCPFPGERLNVMDSIKEAKSQAEERMRLQREKDLAEKQSVSKEALMSQLMDETKELKLIIKADVQGSSEALAQSVQGLGNEDVKVSVVHKGVGAVSESDVQLAQTSRATVVAFRVSTDSRARRLAQESDVVIRDYNIIYEFIDDITKQLEGMLEPDEIQELAGEVEVRETFRISSIGTIAGSYVQSGYVERGQVCRLLRGDSVVYSGKIAALRRFKDDVKRVEHRYECGIRLENFDDIRVGDRIETFSVTTVVKTLN